MIFTKLDLEPGEKIIYEVRRHWIVIFGSAVGTVLMAVLPPVVFATGLYFLPANFVKILLSYFWLELFFYSIWLLLFWVTFFVHWTNYYLDVWYITDKRLIDVNQRSIFHREISNLHFDKIQDVTVEVSGIVATFLKFGELRVQTAAEDSRDYIMKDARRPEEVRRIIFEMHNRGSNMFDRPASKADI